MNSLAPNLRYVQFSFASGKSELFFGPKLPKKKNENLPD
jgi:hypothetical protein